MGNFDTLATFLQMFPNYIRRVASWIPMKNHAIYVEMNDGNSMIFRFKSQSDWSLQSCSAAKSA